MTREDILNAAELYADYARRVGGCSDGYCSIWRPTGMHTNGGCRCTRDMDRMQEARVGHMLRMAQEMARAIIENADSGSIEPPTAAKSEGESE